MRTSAKEVFGVRSIIEWKPRAGQTKKHLYEERITLWNAGSFEQALELAEREAEAYARDEVKRLPLLQAYWQPDGIPLREQGIEVFSLLRESDLAPSAYLKDFFESGSEYQGEGLGGGARGKKPQRRRSRKKRQ